MLRLDVSNQSKEVPDEIVRRRRFFSCQQQFYRGGRPEGQEGGQKKRPNDLFVLRDFLKPCQKDIIGIAVESTFNWYWLVDGLMDSGYKVHLANPSAIQQYSGVKHADDKHDAF
jgi:transposase